MGNVLDTPASTVVSELSQELLKIKFTVNLFIGIFSFQYFNIQTFYNFACRIHILDQMVIAYGKALQVLSANTLSTISRPTQN